MTRLVFFFVVILVITSCQSSVPKDVLPPSKMQLVLWDMMQADEMAYHYSMTDSSFRSLTKHVDYYQKVFAVHKINKEKFATSLTYYENHPAKLKVMLDSLQKFAERIQRADTPDRTLPPIDTSIKTLKKRSVPVE